MVTEGVSSISGTKFYIFCPLYQDSVYRSIVQRLLLKPLIPDLPLPSPYFRFLLPASPLPQTITAVVTEVGPECKVGRKQVALTEGM